MSAPHWKPKDKPACQARVVQCLREGLSFESACGQAGIALVTGWRWRRADAEWDLEVRWAETTAERETLEELKLANTTEHAVRAQNLRWLLQRRWPHRYGETELRVQHEARLRAIEDEQRESVEITPEIAAGLVRLASMTPEDWEAFRAWKGERSQ